MTWREYLNASARAEEKALLFPVDSPQYQKWYGEARGLLERAKRG